jgi:hypothetical protein
VSYATSDGTATAGVDYASASGSLTFAPGVGVRPVTVTVIGDDEGEGNETYNLDLSNAVHATVPLAHGVGTVVNDESAWRLAATGEMNEDYQVDLVWRHDISGEIVIWTMSGHHVATGGWTSPPTLTDLDWRLVGTGTFDQAGRTPRDLVWHHRVSGDVVIWNMDGSGNLLSGSSTTPVGLSDVNWRLVGTGDFNLDERSDLLWHHRLSGEIVVWHMSGAVLASGTFTTPSSLSDTAWKIVGTGDFNQDGRVDIAWRNGTSGQVSLWYMNGTTLAGGTLASPTLADPLWRFAGTGDFNGDTRTDFLWRRPFTGDHLVWFMNGAVQTGNVPLVPPVLY